MRWYRALGIVDPWFLPFDREELSMRYGAWVAVLALCLPIPAGARELEDEVSELRRQVALLTARLDGLERGGVSPVREEAVSAATRKSSGERIRIKGDFRYRHDYIDVEGLSIRNRHRVRARIGAVANLREDVQAGIQLASGPASPRTTSQTLGNAASTKDIGLDLAYVTWQSPIAGLAFTGGKFKNPFYRPAPLVWDSDVNPEGIAVHYGHGDLFATAMAFWTVERSSRDDSFMVGGQLGWRHAFDGGPEVLLGTSVYEYTEIKGETPLFDGNPRGNSVDAAGNYLFGFRQVEVFGEVDLGNVGVPLSLFGQYVKNTEAGALDRAFALGVRGSPLERLELAYTYRDVDADAVLGIFTDSDFGVGSTDVSGHTFESSIDITDGVALKLTYFKSETGDSTGSGTDVDQVFLDFTFKY